MVTQLKTEELEARTYQEVIAASAKDRDTMVVLPTGLGKTVIAAMVASQKVEEGKILVLAPTKPLVSQHKREFNNLLRMDESEMSLLTGEVRPDKRYKLWNDKKAFFATPQVVENDLIAGEVPIDDFSLIVFDESHRATGDYSYVFISEKMSAIQRLGLTASPGGSKQKILDVAENLYLDNFEVRTEDDPDVEPYIQDKEVEWRKVSLNNNFESARSNLQKAYNRQLKNLKKDGFLDSTSNVNKTDLLKLQNRIRAELSNTDNSKHYSAISYVATALKISQSIEFLETQGAKQAHKYLEGLKNDDSKAAARALENENVAKAKKVIDYMVQEGKEHPKIEEIRNIFSQMGESEKGMIFTEYRNSAERIIEILEDEGLKATKFIGQQGDDGMTQDEQLETLSKFDEGEIDILVSTSIGEEGLDIPSVDKVVFYEPVPSGIRDIQRAGRTGRQEKGSVTVLMAENTRDEGYYWSSHHKKKKMNKVLNELKNEDLENSQRRLDNYSAEKVNEKDKGDEEEEDDVEVVVDDRENAIAKKLSKKDEIRVDKTRLDVGDFVASEDVAIERKSTQDFSDSIVDNRLFDQLKDLTNNYHNPVMIIEGEELYGKRNIPAKAIRSALISINMDYDVKTIRTNNEEDTTRYLTSLARREQEDEEKELQVRGKSSGKTEDQRKEFIIAGLPGVNTKLAQRLLKHFDKPQEIFIADKEELTQIKGIGDKKAERIRKILTEKYEK